MTTDLKQTTQFCLHHGTCLGYKVACGILFSKLENWQGFRFDKAKIVMDFDNWIITSPKMPFLWGIAGLQWSECIISVKDNFFDRIHKASQLLHMRDQHNISQVVIMFCMINVPYI